ncbi:hypothetical protein LC612_18095 [Nostoc sp. CHAB 5834]|nr:hypothetical protein [Nostoc sp. CHAB 5834]
MRSPEFGGLAGTPNASRDISLSDRNRIFDHFYRGDPSRTRKIEGNEVTELSDRSVKIRESL